MTEKTFFVDEVETIRRLAKKSVRGHQLLREECELLESLYRASPEEYGRIYQAMKKEVIEELRNWC